MDLAIWVFGVHEQNIARDLAMDADGLNPPENCGARPL
jgi:hypothetical protein